MKHLLSAIALICVALIVISFPTTAQTTWSSATTGSNMTSTEAQFKLGMSCYEKKDYTEAIKWFKKTAEQGYVPAQLMLGICYKYGFGEYGEAMKWFRKAADQGNAQAQYELGYCYEYRLGKKNEAIYWYQKAIENGYVEGNKSVLKAENDSVSVEAREIDIVIDKLNKTGLDVDEEDLGDLSKKEVLDLILSAATLMKRIDTSHCPQDFRIAYEHFVQAVEHMYTVYTGAPEGLWDTLFGGSEFRNNAREALDRFMKAQGEVNESAARHGAKNRVD